MLEGGSCELSSRQCSPAIFLCKDNSCLATFSSNCCDCDSPSSHTASENPLQVNARLPRLSPSPDSQMDQQKALDLANARRLSLAYPLHDASQGPYFALPGPLLERYPPSIAQSSPLPSLALPLAHWALPECPPDCHEPCTPGCDDRTNECTLGCVQVAVPCLDSCGIPTKDCSPDTCPDILSEHTLWATTDWHAHCIPPQFMMNDLPMGEDLQRLFDCCPNTYYPQNDCCIPMPVTDAAGITSSANVNQQTAHTAGLAALFKSYHPQPSTEPQPGPQSISTEPTPELSPLDYFPSAPTSAPSTSAAAFTCQWSNCGQCFNSLGELVGHVNLAHLRLPDSSPSHDHAHGAPACHIAPPSPTLPQATQQSVLVCPWSNCSIAPAPVDAETADLNASLCALASHLFYDHLQLPTQAGPGDLFSLQSPLSPASVTAPSLTNLASPSSHASPSPSIPSTPVLPTLAPQTRKGKEKATTDDLTSSNTHTCGWTDCGQTFTTSALLTEHLSAEHVGRGKASYDCRWAGCARHGPKHGFSSKQKVLRHLQSHTGHRPFRCDVCGLDFSEAATLQQHMRRHTQEKPYVCDFPGCGKAFAITGALTIHKRIHNGDKPFKCKYCDRAFSESSNLSKHLRTHTGARPYACAEPGCGKRFSRPDQVTRHMSKDKDKPSEPKVDEEMEVETESIDD
ncbi:hypothetical protein BDV93DRAFT_521385 [Ceratobasidium sp. AG-I]|nr:hypothetical protein BDV93DRAFT_521385 [Ceratobasidium sp. AG-I]